MRPQRSLELLLFLVLFISFAYFQRAKPGWNANSRLALTYALVERHTARIDSYWTRPDTETSDVAVYKKHYYSDKIIGVSLIGVPAYWILNAASGVFDLSLGTYQKRYLITLLAVGLPGALSSIWMFRLLLIWQARFRGPGGSDSLAGPLIITLSLYLGTMLFSYATLFMSYLPAHAFFVAAWYIFERWRAVSQSQPQETRTAGWMLFLCGILCGFAVLCEYLYGITTALFAVYVACAIRPRRLLIYYAVGAVIGVMPFLFYTLQIFGKPMIPYQYHMVAGFREGMSHGLMGATTPRLDALILLSVHPFRGLFVHSPMLLAGLIGTALMLRHPLYRGISLLSIASICIVFLYTSAYYMWWGGWAFSPRHLAPALALFVPGCLYMWRYKLMRWAYCFLTVGAIALHLIVTATDPQVPEPRVSGSLSKPSLRSGSYPNPFTSQVLPAFRAGHTDPNAGTLLGLPPGWKSVAPLVCIWMLAGTLAFVILRKSSFQEAPPSLPVVD